MDKWILILCFFVIETNIQVSYASENVQFKGPVGALAVNSTSPFTCTTTSDATLVSWLRASTGKSEVTVLSQRVHVNGSCLNNAPDYMDCSCNKTVYRCAIKQVNLTNSGEQWRCSTVMKGIIYFSYAYTVTFTDETNTSPTKELTTGAIAAIVVGFAFWPFGIVIMGVYIYPKYKSVKCLKCVQCCSGAP